MQYGETDIGEQHWLWRRRYAFLSLGLLLFVLLGAWNLRFPGLYYDEVLFVNAALGAPTDIFVLLRLGDLPLMLMPYIGALKAWFYYPIFKLFGVSACSVRLPALLLGALALGLSWRAAQIAFGLRTALLFLLLAAVEPSTLFHTRLDWGPFTLMTLLRALLLLNVFLWLLRGHVKYLYFALIAACVGLFDKLTFIWLCVAAVLALVAVYPGRLWHLWQIQHRHALRLLLLSSAAVLLTLVYLGLLMSLPQEVIPEVDSFDPLQRWKAVQHLLLMTLGGMGVHAVVVDSEGIEPIMNAQLAALGCALVVGLLVRWRLPMARNERLALWFVVLFMVVTLVMLFVTRQATGPHHTAILAPMWLIVLAVLLSPAFDPRAPLHKVLRGAGVLVVVLLVMSSLRIDHLYHDRLRGPVQPRWDPASYELAAVLDELAGDSLPVVSVDWGQGTVIQALLQGDVNIHDVWPLFRAGFSAEQLSWYEAKVLAHGALVVVPAESYETFPECRANFFRLAEEREWSVEHAAEVRGQRGATLFEVYRVRTTR